MGSQVLHGFSFTFSEVRKVGTSVRKSVLKCVYA